MRTGHGQKHLSDERGKEIPGKNALESAYYFISDAPIKAVCNPSAYAQAGA